MDLEALQSLVTVAEQRSFSGAARSLGLSTAAVSRQVKKIEIALEVQLLFRTTRSVSLTDAGVRLLPRFRQLLQDAAALSAEALDVKGAATGTVRLTAPRHLGPALMCDLPGFLEDNPGLRVEILLDDRNQDLVSEGIDIAVRLGPLADSSLVARRLGEAFLRLVASPAWVALNGTDNPWEHPVVIDTAAPMDHTWHLPEPVLVRSAVSVNDAGMARDLAIAGIGPTLLPGVFLVDALRSGQLVDLAPGRSLEGFPVSLVFPPARYRAPAVRALVDFLEHAVRNLLDRAA